MFLVEDMPLLPQADEIMSGLCYIAQNLVYFKHFCYRYRQFLQKMQFVYLTCDKTRISLARICKNLSSMFRFIANSEKSKIILKSQKVMFVIKWYYYPNPTLIQCNFSVLNTAIHSLVLCFQIA